MKEQKSRYLKIVKARDVKDCYILFNIQQDEKIGFIQKRRVGRFMHWCLEPEPETYFSNGCLKEISAFITKLYGVSKNE